MLNKKITREIIYILLAFSGALMVFLNTWNYGSGLTDDSINYIYSGTNLYVLKGFYNYDGSVFINWPPLYSFVIFIISLIGSDIYLLMIIFNALLYSFTIFLLGKLSETIFSSPIMKILYTATLTFSFQMLFIYTKLFSETIFITLIIFIILLFQYNGAGTGKGCFALLLALCVLTRYLGISIVITYFLYKIFLDIKSDSDNKCFYKKTLLYGILAILPASIWFLRNRYMTSNMTTLHFNSLKSIFENFFHLFYSTSALFIPESLDTNIRISIFILLLSIIFVLYFKLKIEFNNNKFLSLFSLLYISLLVLLASFLKFDKISFRFILPLYFILLIYVFYFFEHIIKSIKQKGHYILTWIILSVIILFPIEKGIKHTMINYSNGIDDFHSKKWKESETISYIKTNLYNSKIYSNSVAGIYANTGLKTDRISNYFKINSKEIETVQIIFNNTLPAIDTIPDLSNIISIGDSIIYFSDSYIIMKKN